MKVEHLIFLIHSGAFESVPPDVVRKRNLGVYVELEKKVKQRWLDALGRQDRSVLFLQLCGPLDLLEAAREKLGEPNACYVYVDPPESGERREYIHLLTQCIRDHMEKFDLEFDAATVTSEVWGETFEGCASGYSGAFAEHLGLKRPPRMAFEMTVYDTRFLYEPRRWETIHFEGTDVEAWVFECHNFTSAAMFQARLTDRWFDKRPISLELDAITMQVCLGGAGHMIWPESPPPGKGVEEDIRTFVMTVADSHWIRAIRTNFDELKRVVSAAQIGENPPSATEPNTV